MNSVLVRLIIAKSGKEYNVLFDRSFSLKENLELLSSITDESFNECFVYDKKLKIFLNKNIPLDLYKIPSSRVFYIY